MGPAYARDAAPLATLGAGTAQGMGRSYLEGEHMSDPTTGAEKGAFFTAKNILAIIIAVAALVFVFSNMATAELNLFGARIALPGWVWLILLLAIGFVVGSLFPWFKTKKK
ncbi:LapA family protein [Leucobacter weissii]|uniref:LapA family protein n=1 Tax=Leucobacter weissii TaxID=1983706 RepID=A0A939MM02_9MICO|nr:LapA family protein [Leucobacter weissii]MBO1902340.1 LapA family protein [Leucobacter weissii]